MDRILSRTSVACLGVISFLLLVPWTTASAGPPDPANPLQTFHLYALKKRRLKNGLPCSSDSRFHTGENFHRRSERP